MKRVLVLVGHMGEQHEIIFLHREDFRDFPVGEFPYHYGAHGEYHYWPIKGYRGNWYEPTIKSNWRSHHWLAIESGGEHLMVQATVSTSVASMLATGDPDWEEYADTCTVRPCVKPPASP